MSYINLLEKLRQDLAKKSGIPSGVASADDDKKKVKEALDQTDPERKSQVLPKFANMMEQIMQLLGSIGMGQGGGGGQQQPTANQAGNPNTAVSSVAIDDIAHGLAGALEIEANTRGANLVMTVYNAILGNNTVGIANYNSLIPEYQSIVTEASSLFNSDLAANTPMNSVIVPINNQIVANSVNSAIPPVVVNTVPDFYYEVHLPADQIPYYGYTQYMSIGDHQVVYTPVNYETTPVFAYLNDSIVYRIQETFVADLDPYFAQANLPFTTFVSILDNILDTYVRVIDNASFGNGNLLPSQTNPQNQQSQNQNQNQNQQSQNQNNNMVGQLLPVLNQLIQSAQSEHLPKSILDKQKVSKCLDNHGQNCGKAAQMKQLAQQAIQPGGIMGGGGGGGSGLGGG